MLQINDNEWINPNQVTNCSLEKEILWNKAPYNNDINTFIIREEDIEYYWKFELNDGYYCLSKRFTTRKKALEWYKGSMEALKFVIRSL